MRLALRPICSPVLVLNEPDVRLPSFPTMWYVPSCDDAHDPRGAAGSGFDISDEDLTWIKDSGQGGGTRFYAAPLRPCQTGSTTMAVCAPSSSVIMVRHRRTFTTSSPQQRVSSLVPPGIGLVLALRMRLMVVMCSAFDVMWASLSRGSLLVTAFCVCRLWVCPVL